MSATMPRLIATAWTSAGDTSPRRTPQVSPVPIAERVAAVADAGYSGMGLIAAALAIVSWDTVRQHREIDPQMGQE